MLDILGIQHYISFRTHMKVKRIKLLIVITACIALVLNETKAQWSKKMANDVAKYNFFIQTGNNSIVAYRVKVNQDLELNSFDFQGNLNWSCKINQLRYSQDEIIFDNFFSSIPFLTIDSDESLLARPVRSFNELKFSVINIDAKGKPVWEKIITHDINFTALPSFLQINLNSFYAIASARTSNSSNTISFLHFSREGELLAERQIIDNNELAFDRYKFAKIDNNKFAIIKVFSTNKSVVTIFDKDIKYIEGFEVDFIVNQILYRDENYFLSGEPGPFDFFDAPPLIAKIDANLTLKWAKKMNINSVTDFYKLQIIGSELFHKAFSLDPRFSIISKISEEGIIIDQSATQSSPLNPNITFNAFQNNSLIDLQEVNGKLALSQITPDLKSSCFLPKVCVDIQDFEVNIERLDNNIYDPFDLEVTIEDVTTEIEELNVEIEDICFEPNFSFPVPFFTVEDTVCVNELIEITNLHNDSASEINWSLIGASVENTITNSPGVFSYSEPGNYTITQSIVFEGCPSEFSQDIVVVAPIQLPSDEAINLCEPQEFLIDAEHENLLSYLWQDGSSESTFLTTAEGEYTVSLEDKHCVQEVIFQVNYLDLDTLSTSLGSDTTICSQLPLAISPSINPELDFQWTDGHPNLDRLVSESGLYTLITTLGECSTSSTIIVEVEDCNSKVFMPNVFSPNDDGVNDTIYPLGEQFELLAFIIYDKWGNEVHNQLEPWDGMVRSKKGHLGIYVYSALILNTKLGVEELFQGEFTLVR